MKTVGVTDYTPDYTNQTPSEHFERANVFSSNPQKVNKIFAKCAQTSDLYKTCTSSDLDKSAIKVSNRFDLTNRWSCDHKIHSVYMRW